MINSIHLELWTGLCSNHLFIFRKKYINLPIICRFPINKYPLITVYNSNEEGSIPFANIGYAGIIGSITSVNSKGVSISEKVWIPSP